MNTQTISLDLSKRPAVTPVLYLGQGDKNGTTLNVDVFDNGLPYSLVSYSARLAIRMPKGEGYYEKVGTISGNRATFAIDETHAATVAGTTDIAYVEVYSGSTLIASTQRFRVVILENATENTDPTRAYTNGVEEFLNDSETALRTMMNQAEADVDESIVRLNDAINTIGGVTNRAEAAIDAMGDISELAVPLMSADTRGGATLGTGLRVDEGSLSLGDVVTDSCDGPIFSVDAEGWSEQASTTGKNLLPNTTTSQTVNGVTFTVKSDGSVTLNGTATNDIYFRIATDLPVTQGQAYTLSGCPSGGSLSKYWLLAYAIMVDGSLQYDFGSGATGTANAEKTNVEIVVKNGNTFNNLVFRPQLESGSTATSYEPYTGAKPSPSPDYPQEIRVCRGRNLLDESALEAGYIKSDGSVGGTGTASYKHTDYIEVTGGETYTLSLGVAVGGAFYASWHDSSKTLISTFNYDGVKSKTVQAPSNAKYVRVSYELSASQTAQLELGSTPTPYVPYGCVGLDIYDANNAHVSTVPIPLPSKGWAGGLPDGTADALSIDSAGKWEWTNNANEVVLDGSTIVSNSIDNSQQVTQVYFSSGRVPNIKKAVNYEQIVPLVASSFVMDSVNGCYRSTTEGLIAVSPTGTVVLTKNVSSVEEVNTWLASNPVTFLYPTENYNTEHGYVDLPLDIPEGSTIAIPELEGTNIKCFVPGAKELAIHAANWGHRNAEMESRLATLEATVAELATA